MERAESRFWYCRDILSSSFCVRAGHERTGHAGTALEEASGFAGRRGRLCSQGLKAGCSFCTSLPADPCLPAKEKGISRKAESAAEFSGNQWAVLQFVQEWQRDAPFCSILQARAGAEVMQKEGLTICSRMKYKRKTHFIIFL